MNPLEKLSDAVVFAVVGAVLLLMFAATALAVAVAFGVDLTSRAFLGFAFGYLVNLLVYFLALALYLAVERREADPGDPAN